MQARLNGRMDTLGKRLRFARQERKLTRPQLAELSGVKRSDVSILERGDSQTTTGLVRLASALTCNPEWLDTGDGVEAAELANVHGERDALVTAMGKKSCKPS